MKRYAAYIGGARVLSVIADTEDEARERVREQLNRPGRRGHLRAWINNGEEVREE